MEKHTGYNPEYLKRMTESKSLPLKFMFLNSTYMGLMYTCGIMTEISSAESCQLLYIISAVIISLI